MEPRFKHDADCCAYVGQVWHYDVYACRSCESSSTIMLLRYGDEPHENQTMSFATHDMIRNTTKLGLFAWTDEHQANMAKWEMARNLCEPACSSEVR